MPVPIQTGESQARLRRLLGIDAGLPLSLDEVCVPVALVGNGDQAPYRTTGRKWVSDGDNQQAAVVGQFSSLGIKAAAGAITVIEGFRFRILAAGPTLCFGRLDVGYLPASGVVCLDVESPRSVTEDSYRPAGPLIQGAAAAGAPTGSLVWWGFGNLTPDPSQGNVVLDHPLVLLPDPTQNQSFILTPSIVNLGIGVQFWGRVFDLA